MKKPLKSKKAVSLIISYILLIVIALSLAGIVYPFIKKRIYLGEENNCDDRVSLILKDYSCNDSLISLMLENKGYFNIDGFYIRASNSIDKLPTIGLISADGLSEKGVYEFLPPLSPSETRTARLNYSNVNPIKKIEVQPYILKEEKRNSCPDTFSLEISPEKQCLSS